MKGVFKTNADTLELKELKLEKPAANEILIRHTAIEVNWVDIHQKLSESFDQTKPIGVAAIGVIEQVGTQVSGFKVGDTVMYAFAKHGAYATHNIISQDIAINIGVTIDNIKMAAWILKGLTASMLVMQTFVLHPNATILVHGACGGIGSLICQYAKVVKTKVIPVVRGQTKKQYLLSNGYQHAIDKNAENIAEKVMQYTNNQGVNVIYQCSGQAIMTDIKMLKKFGIIIGYATIGGTFKFDPNLLFNKSLFFTMPSVYHYKQNKTESLLSLNDIATRINQKELNPSYKTFKLQDAADAHTELEEAKNIGSIVLIP